MKSIVDIARLEGAAIGEALRDLAAVLVACVADGASVGFMQPYTLDAAMHYWQAVARDAEAGRIFLFVARQDGTVIGTVQVAPAAMPNQPHRGDLRKLLVHPAARGQGLARMLMERAEAEAARQGLSLLVLDTATGSDAEAIYPRLGWQRSGIIPDYAMWPQGGYCDTTIFYKKLAAHP